jgi:DNA replication protein DnaC
MNEPRRYALTKPQLRVYAELVRWIVDTGDANDKAYLVGPADCGKSLIIGLLMQHLATIGFESNHIRFDTGITWSHKVRRTERSLFVRTKSYPEDRTRVFLLPSFDPARCE